MRPPLIRRPNRSANHRNHERGVTLALVAVAIVGIISMAALSIDVGTLYQASAEAQRSADTAALAAARVLSLSGITGDPANSASQWINACNAATTTAQTIANQNTIGGVAPTSVTTTFSSTDGSNCGSTGTVAFGVNPMVTVKVTQNSLPVFFARVFGLVNGNWRSLTVNATATAEVYNPAGSATFAGGTIIPVQPRCVKPWIVPNIDPKGATFVSVTDGSITHPGIELAYAGLGTVGESLVLQSACTSTTGPCVLGPLSAGKYAPALVQGTSVGVPSCANTNPYQEAVGGCDQTTVYTCGELYTTSGATQMDLNENPTGPVGDTAIAAECLTGQTSGGQDQIDNTQVPFQFRAGSGNALVSSGQVNASANITTSNSIVSLPIYDNTAPLTGVQPPVTILGFLQVFVGTVLNDGSLQTTVLNVTGCGNGQTTPVSTSPLTGSSPVPVRLITPTPPPS